jgi:ABC-type multidrug transport system fused ATPase/permease subunit
MFIITHNIVTSNQADKMIVLNSGRIAPGGYGAPKDVMIACEEYNKLVLFQNMLGSKLQ